jgi:hypothetical protein
MQHVLPIREPHGVTPHMMIKTTHLNRGKEKLSAFCSRCPWEMHVYVFGALKKYTHTKYGMYCHGTGLINLLCGTASIKKFGLHVDNTQFNTQNE